MHACTRLASSPHDLGRVQTRLGIAAAEDNTNQHLECFASSAYTSYLTGSICLIYLLLWLPCMHVHAQASHLEALGLPVKKIPPRAYPLYHNPTTQ